MTGQVLRPLDGGATAPGMVVALASPTAVVAQVACLRLLVQCVELPGERRVVIGEGADLRLIGVLLLHALRTRPVHVGPGVHSGQLHRTALLSLAVREGAARNSAHRYVGCVPARGARGRLAPRDARQGA